MFINRNDANKHRILQVLLKKAMDSPDQYSAARDTAITVTELAQKLKLTKQKVYEATAFLLKEGEIRADDFGEGESYFAWQHSYTALAEKKYLREGRKKFNDAIFDVVKWLVPATLCFVTIYGMITNKHSVEKLTTQIDTLKSRLDTLDKVK